MSSDHVLEIEALSVQFGGVRAVNEVSLAVRPGTVHGLLGPNGSGKTTVLNAACGFVRSSGRVSLEGRVLSSLPPHKRSQLGLLRTFQNPKLVQHLTVAELLRMGEHAQSVRPWWLVAANPLADRKARLAGRRHAQDVLELLRLDPAILGARIDSLPQGVLKMVDIARALMAEPKVLLLDEPSSGMSESEIDGLRERLLDLKARGTALVLVEHNIGLVEAVCDEVTVLNLGTFVCTGPPAEVLERDDVIEAFLGTSARREPQPSAPKMTD